MKVILVKSVPNLGKIGEIKDVSDGFARNYLLPNKLVKLATEKSVREIAQEQSQKVRALENRAKKFKALAKKINNIKIIIKAKASAASAEDLDKDEKKTLYAAITAQRIAEELKDRKYELDSKYIKLEQPIKSLGFYDILVDFGAGVTAKVGLTVIREE